MSQEVEEIAAQVVSALALRKETVATCESLTGGGIGAAITAVAGASAVFRGGLITYSTALKAELLGVDLRLIDEAGVVSDQTASWMTEGARNLCRTDWGISVTGVAGPDWLGGEPPGTVFIGIAGPAGPRWGPTSGTERHRFEGSREQVRDLTVKQALNSLLRRIGMLSAE